MIHDPSFFRVSGDTLRRQRIQSVDETKQGWFVYLDTHQPGTAAGHYIHIM